MDSDFSFFRLTASHTIKNFDCEDDDIDLKEFLVEDSLLYLKQLLAVTYIIEDSENTIAYFSVANDKISITEAASNTFWKKQVSQKLNFQKRGFKNFPAVKIGRLAVNKNYQRRGLGTDIINWVKESFITNNKTGCLFIIVDAINRPKTITFYKKCGFNFLNPIDAPDKTRLMYYCLLEEEEQ